MGCISTSSRITRVKRDLDKKEKLVAKLNNDLNNLNELIKKKQAEGKEDEVKLKLQDYELKNKEKCVLTNEIIRLKKIINNLEQVTKKNDFLKIGNEMNKKQISEEDEQNKQLQIRQRQQEQLLEAGDRNIEMMDEEERQMQNENYQRVPNTNTKRINQEYPLPNNQYQFLSLNPQQNINQNQPHIQNVQSGIYN